MYQEGFTAVLPSVTQGNLNTPLIPESNEMGKDEAEVLAKWRGLKTVDLTDGIMETRVPNVDGTPTVVKYDVPLVRPNGKFSVLSARRSRLLIPAFYKR